MKEGLQNTLIKKMAESGCYFLCLCKLAEKEGVEVNVLKEAEWALEKGFIDENFYLKEPEIVLNHLLESVSKVCSIKYSSEKRSDRYNIREWFNSKTGFTHFTLKDWDPMKDSNTVRNGSVRSYRQVDIWKA